VWRRSSTTSSHFFSFAGEERKSGLDVTPKKVFGALSAVVMSATSGPEEAQAQFVAAFGLA